MQGAPYTPNQIEPKWQKYWEEHNTFATDVWDFSKPKYYVLDMFPYPSGVGLHAGPHRKDKETYPAHSTWAWKNPTHRYGMCHFPPNIDAIWLLFR